MDDDARKKALEAPAVKSAEGDAVSTRRFVAAGAPYGVLIKASLRGTKMGRMELMRFLRARSVLAAAFAAGAVLLVPRPLWAQQQTFHLDRLEVPGAPDDGAILFRPVTQPGPIVYTQFGLGLAVNPLRTSEITNSRDALRASPHDIITGQFSTYMSAGGQALNHLTIRGTFPVAWIQGGNQPLYPAGVFAANAAYT